MNILTLNEEFTPLSFGILNENGEVVFGDAPCERYDSIIEYEYVLNKNHYKFVATFGNGTERQQAAFALALASANTMLNPAREARALNFYSFYPTLLELLHREISSSNLVISEKDTTGKFAPVLVYQRGFFTCVLLLCAYIINCGATATIDHEEYLNEVLLTVSTEDLQKTIPRIVIDYCIELANTNSFGLTIEYKDSFLRGTVKLNKGAVSELEFKCDPWYNSEFDEISRAVDLFFFTYGKYGK